MTGPVRVLVVDDHPVVARGVALLAMADPRVSVIGDARTADEAAAMAPDLRPDLILHDLRLPDMPAPESIRRLRALVPGVKILIFTAHATHPALKVALDAGADGGLLKDASDADLIDAIVRAAAGEHVMEPRLRPDSRPRDFTAGRDIGLTPREYEILRHVAMGETNPEIAAAINLSRFTVKTYLQSALMKLGARNRIDALIKAGELGLL